MKRPESHRGHSLLLAAALLLIWPFPAFAAESWRCKLNLHQGDVGELQFARDGGRIAGVILIGDDDRRDGPGYRINGTWNGESVQFRRLLNGGTYQDFKGVAILIDTQVARLAGRFASGFRGLWSADCKSSAQPEQIRPAEPPTPPPAPTPGGPSMNTRIQPYEPTTSDRVQFIANASHSSGVRDIQIVVNGRVRKTCATNDCVYRGGPYPAGTLRWHYIARSRNGGVTQTRTREIRIPQTIAQGNCRISGRATGSRADSSSVFFVAIQGTGANSRFVDSTPFRGGAYSFTGLPEGRYTVSSDSRGDTPVSVSPRSRTVNCTGTGPRNVNFAFN